MNTLAANSLHQLIWEGRLLIDAIPHGMHAAYCKPTSFTILHRINTASSRLDFMGSLLGAGSQIARNQFVIIRSDDSGSSGSVGPSVANTTSEEGVVLRRWGLGARRAA